MPDPRGFWGLVLHAHLPFVRHPQHEHFLEEDWFYEAVIETYLPLLRMMDNLDRDRVRFRLTLTLSPPLLAMMQDSLLLTRCQRRLDGLLRLASKEARRTSSEDGAFHEATLAAERDLSALKELFVATHRRDLVGAFSRHRATGSIEILTCAATHAFLPLMSHTEEAVRAQIQVAVADFERIFGYHAEGIWLPECGYFEGIETLLVEAGLRYSFLEAHGVTDASPSPSFGVMAPILSTGGIAFFGRDLESSRQVWSSEAGYPGDPDYREFYKDAGYELPIEDLLEFMNPDEPRRPVGLKRHRVSGKVALHHKQPYVRDWALGRVAAHAAHFANERAQQTERARSVMPHPPFIVSPYDAELFGHWWYEGPQFLEQVFRNLADRGDVVAATPPEYLGRFDECELTTPHLSTWGEEGYASVWLNEANDWIYPHYDAAARRMIRLANRFPEAGGLLTRALNQAARELMLAQSSDWAFIMRSGTMVQYATERLIGHLQCFADLASGIEEGTLDEERVASAEAEWPIFPAMDYRVFASRPR
ncbi:MAG: DUF1957 domain-containing protein [Vicinamibacteria bacterium]|nr:DUF1957 domain-containing protein [Vicinamibacteria bacterium]